MALEGTLQDMALSDLFQVFRMGPKSGILLLNQHQDRGAIYVNRGQLIDAFIVRGPDRKVITTRDEAVITMLGWEDATFIFRHDLDVGNRPVRIEHDSEWLILEGMRRRSNPIKALPYHSITLDTRLQLAPLPNSAETGVSLDVDQWRILSQVAGNQDVRSICAITNIAEEKALRIVAELLSIGLVEIAPPSIEQRPPRATLPNTKKSRPQMAMAGIAGSEGIAQTEDEQPKVGRSLLNAIMRRIGEL
ncbi:MAG: DUF4388 domain-containing protein [Chloroflexaceae bacterium]|nr:DUF4388 domain-containing protein [Chloroflexaceae bacterium]